MKRETPTDDDAARSVAGAEGKAQTDSLERGLASAIERAQKPELRVERTATLAQIRREPATRAKSTSDGLRSVSIDVPQELFGWLGIKPAKFQADFS
jgi:hypothetical protein